MAVVSDSSPGKPGFSRVIRLSYAPNSLRKVAGMPERHLSILRSSISPRERIESAADTSAGAAVSVFRQLAQLTVERTLGHPTAAK
jgi:hypothetical protein